ncbi:hypothetical protein NU08_0318 [Flavobacterium anhuiense]|uniref:Uncharacterized protein n=1 Tax=Flavobacterium anhuiense TaxID=459526 RepID=A0A444W4T0_9FLAO|nr:hypothetical protein NU08_0318 [Flavobacterium anhuiense]
MNNNCLNLYQNNYCKEQFQSLRRDFFIERFQVLPKGLLKNIDYKFPKMKNQINIIGCVIGNLEF